MDPERSRQRLFFLLYAALLLFAFVWLRLPVVRAQTGQNLGLVHALLGVGLCYLAFRAWMVLCRSAVQVPSWLWLSVDLALITAIVHLTGGVQSMAALAYLIPVLTASVALRARRAALSGLAGGVLYVIAAGSLHPLPGEVGWLTTSLFFLATVTVMASWYATAERAQVNEVARLREQLALADYRAELSRELHDGIQHYLVVAGLRLEMARHVAGEDPARAVEVALDVRHTLRQAADELRYLIRRLRSPRLERHGFLEALREHITLYADSAPFTVELETEAGEVHLPPEVEQIAFRVIQEALTNAEKHASASRVQVSISVSPQRLECLVVDDGQGFEPADHPPDPAAVHGLGLESMRQRAQSVDGKLEIVSRPGEGTRVRLTVPVAEYVARRDRELAAHGAWPAPPGTGAAACR